MKEYEFHEYANKFRLMNEAEYEGFKEDIRNHGLLNQLILFEGKILDGRNRYKACKELGIELKYIQYKGTKEEAFYFVVSENLYRRHLNLAERAEIGLIILDQEEKWAQERMREAQHKFSTLEEQTPATPSDGVEDTNKHEGEALRIASKKTGVGRETLRTAKKVRDSNDDLVKKKWEDYKKGKKGSTVKAVREVEKVATKVKKMNDPKINKKWEQAKQGKTTIKAVKMALDKKSKPKFVPIIPEDKYELIYADPPWEYNFTQSPTRTIEKEYPTMKLKEICKLRVPSAKDCILFLWCTSPKLYPEGMEVIKSWGFTYKTSMVWVKDKIGMGYYARSRHEFILIATKGNPGVPEPSDRYDSVIEQPRTEHSKKPEIVYEMIEKMYPNKKKIELFARNKREGWNTWGNEV